MKVRAIAAASPRSNAVGTLDLECTPRGLDTTYLGVGTYSDGYAPGILTNNQHVVVPWDKVKAAQLHGDRVWLEVDEEVTPHNRLMLMNFSEASQHSVGEVRRRRRLLIVGGAAVAAIAALLALSRAPGFTDQKGAVAALWLGGVVAVGMLAVALVTGGRTRLASPEGARAQFFADLVYYLPTLARYGSALPRASAPRPGLQEALPRTTTAVVITLSACTLGAVLTLTWMFREDPSASRPARDSRPATDVAEPALTPRPAPTPAPPEPATPPQPTAAPAPAGSDAARAGTACQCERSDSVLWRDPLPRLTPLLIAQKSRPHNNHSHLELELAVVNNGKQDVRELTLHVQFSETRPGEKRARPTKDRSLYFEGPLRAGHAIKWHVEARGNAFEVHGFDSGMLDPNGQDAAPADEFAELLDANHRPVRLHAAMMLAFLGDPRARGGALELREALRETEAPYLDRVLQAVSPLRACDLRVTGTGTQFRLNTCLYNSASESLTGLGLSARALDGPVDHRSPVARPPLVVAEKVFAIEPTLEPKHGQRISVDLDTTNVDGVLPKEFEVIADRIELLR